MSASSGAAPGRDPQGAGAGIRHVLIHANGDDTASLATALRVARQAALELEAGTRFHVVVQGPLVRRLSAGGGLVDDLNATMSATVSVSACHNSMDRAGVSDQELLPKIGTVPSAGAFLAARQWEGWAYLRY